MGNTTTAFIFVMVVNVLMWFSQLSMINISAADATQYYNCSSNILANFGDCETYAIDQNVEDHLPSSGGSVAPSTGNIFTDIFNNILSWIKGIPGVNYVYAMVTAPATLLGAIGLPGEIAFGLGVLWYGLSLFFLVAFLWGRE